MKFATQANLIGTLLVASVLGLAQNPPATARQLRGASVVSPEKQNCCEKGWQNSNLNTSPPTFPCEEKLTVF